MGAFDAACSFATEVAGAGDETAGAIPALPTLAVAPNPFNASTTISLGVARTRRLRIAGRVRGLLRAYGYRRRGRDAQDHDGALTEGNTSMLDGSVHCLRVSHDEAHPRKPDVGAGFPDNLVYVTIISANVR